MICLKKTILGLYTYDGRSSVSAVIATWGDHRAIYWYNGLGNVKSQIHGYGAFGSGKKYYGYNAEQYNPVTGNQNLRNRQVNIRRQRFFTEDTYLGNKTDVLSINRYIYANDNPLRYNDPSGYYICIGGHTNPFIDILLNYKNQVINIYGDVKNILLDDNMYENLGRYIGMNDTNAIANFVYRNNDIFSGAASAINNTGVIQNFFENQSVRNSIYNII